MTARDELYAYITVAFQETGVPPVVHDHVNKLIAERDAEVMEEAAEIVSSEAWPHERAEAENRLIHSLAEKIEEKAAQVRLAGRNTP